MNNWLFSECQGVDLSGSTGASAQYQGLAKILQGKDKSKGNSGSGGGGGADTAVSGGGEGGNLSSKEKEEEVLLGGIQRICKNMSIDVQDRRQGVQGLVDLVHGLVEEDTGRYRDFIAVRRDFIFISSCPYFLIIPSLSSLSSCLLLSFGRFVNVVCCDGNVMSPVELTMHLTL